MEKNRPPKFVRKQYIVSKKFQFRYIGMILALMFATAALCSYVVYYNSLVLLGEKLANVYPQGRLVAILKTVNLRVLVSVILISPFVAFLGVILSHRIAGPITRMERFLSNVAAGDLSKRLTLRPKDELIPLADGINTVVETINKNVLEKKARMDNVQQELSILKKELEGMAVDSTSLKNVISRLQSEVNSLKKEIDKYKVA